jgi:hypothetical protein
MAKVLFVSSDQPFEGSISSQLTSWGYITSVSRTGEKACAIVKAVWPDAAIIDDNLSGPISSPDFSPKKLLNFAGVVRIWLVFQYETINQPHPRDNDTVYRKTS